MTPIPNSVNLIPLLSNENKVYKNTANEITKIIPNWTDSVITPYIQTITPIIDNHASILFFLSKMPIDLTVYFQN